MWLKVIDHLESAESIGRLLYTVAAVVNSVTGITEGNKRLAIVLVFW